MKKVLCLVLALVLCMSSAALASSTPSKTTQDLLPTVEATTENGRALTVVVREDNASRAQLRVLQGTPAKDDYFGDIVKQDGATAKLSELLNPNDINEFESILVYNYNPSMGSVTALIRFITPFALSDKVIVLIGLTDGELTWYAFDAEVVDYKDNDWIRVVFPAEIVEKIQANGGLIAIVSQSAGAFQR